MTAVVEIIEDELTPALTPDQANHKQPPPVVKAGARSDDDYVISAFADGLRVFEALKGQAYEAVTISEVSRRTGFKYDLCRRALKTLKVCGWAIEDDRGWRLSVKAMQFSSDFIAFAASLPGGSDSTRGIGNIEK